MNIRPSLPSSLQYCEKELQHKILYYVTALFSVQEKPSKRRHINQKCTDDSSRFCWTFWKWCLPWNITSCWRVSCQKDRLLYYIALVIHFAVVFKPPTVNAEHRRNVWILTHWAVWPPGALQGTLSGERREEMSVIKTSGRFWSARPERWNVPTFLSSLYIFLRKRSAADTARYARAHNNALAPSNKSQIAWEIAWDTLQIANPNADEERYRWGPFPNCLFCGAKNLDERMCSPYVNRYDHTMWEMIFL